eukprot:scaffold3348_cov113-Isochrysis_galbana.AAC.7
MEMAPMSRPLPTCGQPERASEGGKVRNGIQLDCSGGVSAGHRAVKLLKLSAPGSIRDARCCGRAAARPCQQRHLPRG